MKKLTREWVKKAEGDYRVAHRVHLAEPPDHDIVCFHCQQCIEKYLKALLVEQGLTVPKTHKLLDLLALLAAVYSTLRSFKRGLQTLTEFAVDPRYPVMVVTKRQAVSAMRWLERIRQECRDLLGLKPPKPRKNRP